MSETPLIHQFDSDGALQETAAEAGITRSALFARTALAGGAVLSGGVLLGVLPSAARAATPDVRSDLAILNFALTLEYLEAEFYNQAVENINFTGELEYFATNVRAHENVHVTALRATIDKLGGKPVAKPTFAFGQTVTDLDKFMATSQFLEDTGVRAYLGQTTHIRLDPVLLAAAQILAVEARHAAWIRSLNIDGTGNHNPAPEPFNSVLSKRAVLERVAKSGFIVA